MSLEDYHLVPHINGWAVKREGAPSATAIHPTKDEALVAGRRLAQASHGRLMVHSREGVYEDTGDVPSPKRQGG